MGRTNSKDIGADQARVTCSWHAGNVFFKAANLIEARCAFRNRANPSWGRENSLRDEK
jgi:hypothetical protein